MKHMLGRVFVILMLFSGFCFARPDGRTFYEDVDILAVWLNPKVIKVYITPDETKEYILERSFNSWDRALAGDLNFKYVDNPTEADIIIKYVNGLTGNAAGHTKTSHVKIQGKIYLSKAEILISKISPEGLVFTDVQLNKITLHEIGHAIGILGHSENITDIMYYSTASSRLSTLSSRDIDTVRKIYGF